MEIALLAALVKVLDGYYTPLGHRVKCWKLKGQDQYFMVGMTNPQFDGTNDMLDWILPIEYWNKFNCIEIKLEELPLYNEITTPKTTIQKLYKI